MERWHITEADTSTLPIQSIYLTCGICILQDGLPNLLVLQAKALLLWSSLLEFCGFQQVIMIPSDLAPGRQESVLLFWIPHNFPTLRRMFLQGSFPCLIPTLELYNFLPIIPQVGRCHSQQWMQGQWASGIPCMRTSDQRKEKRKIIYFYYQLYLNWEIKACSAISPWQASLEVIAKYDVRLNMVSRRDYWDSRGVKLLALHAADYSFVCACFLLNRHVM